MALLFYSEGVNFQLDKPRKTSTWIKASIKNEHKHLSSLSYIFCSDAYLLKLNRQYLNHDELTDILTFNYSEDSESIFGEVFISIDRVTENSQKFKKTFDNELHRVIIHGLLHLVGYDDKKAADRASMRKKEEAYLSLR
jgi:probable rRNA maturation factor